MEYLISALLGYAFGSINSAYFIAKAKGFDIRTRGSFNAGASNAKITMGWPYFFIVLAFDSLKAFLCILAMRHIFHFSPVAQYLAGTMAVIGHCFPFYLQFKGGKGYASFIGLMVAIDWKFGLLITFIGVALALLSNWIVTSTLFDITVFPVYMGALKKTGWMAVAVVAIASLVILYKHSVNFKKLANHQEIGINGCYVGTHTKAKV